MPIRKVNPVRAARAFGETLRQARREAGFTQEQLAEAAILDASYISLLERGRRTPTLTVLYQLADALDISVAYLVGTAREKLP